VQPLNALSPASHFFACWLRLIDFGVAYWYLALIVQQAEKAQLVVFNDLGLFFWLFVPEGSAPSWWV
jgi:hypothetical protein